MTASELLHLLHGCKTLSSLKKLHARVLSHGLLSSSSISSLLINLYSSLLQPTSALAVLTSNPNPSLLLWNSLIKSQIQSEFPQNAIKFYHLLLRQGFKPDNYTFTFVLKACAAALDSNTGQLIHQDVKRRGMNKDLFISTALVDMYCKLGLLSSALEVFDEMPVRDVVTWNAMIAGFSNNGCSYEALDLFKSMQVANQAPNFITVINLFPSISRLSNLSLCKAIHCFSLKRCILGFVSNGLIDVYSKCGSLEIAHKVFDEMSSVWDDVSWATIISGYVHNRFYTEALDLFDAMRVTNAKPNQVAVLSALTAAGESKNLHKGLDIHNYAVNKRLNFNLGVYTALFTMYAKCQDIKNAKFIFKNIDKKDIIAWSAMISSFAQNGYSKDALLFFKNLQNEGYKPNIVTIISVLPACADLLNIKLGLCIHCFALKHEMVSDLTLGTSLVSFYAKVGIFKYARIIFDQLIDKKVVTWNALINGYAQFNEPLKALQIFSKMKLIGLDPNNLTMISVISAYASLNCLKGGKSLHSMLVKLGFDYDINVKNAILELYSKCGDDVSSNKILSETKSFNDIISWNTMVSGYMHNGKPKKAILTFCQMREEYIKPNDVTLITIIPAFAYLTLLKPCMSLHSYIIKLGFVSYISISNSLIDMYSKCGKIHHARKVFDEMRDKDIISWNTILVGYSIHGLSHETLSLFSQMIKYKSIQTDELTYLAVLSACRHGGLVKEGKQVFNLIKNDTKLGPNIEHFACMVDMLGRTGEFEEAWDLIKNMKILPDKSIWGALLGACKMHGNMKLGEIAMKKLQSLGQKNGVSYLEMSNIYAQNGRWVDAGKMRRLIRDGGLKKNPGCSNLVPAL